MACPAQNSDRLTYDCDCDQDDGNPF